MARGRQHIGFWCSNTRPSVLARSSKFSGKELGLGVVNPRTDTVESSVTICRAVERAIPLYAPEQIFLNPDCGFATFSGRPVNDQSIALAKLQAMAGAARRLRG